MRNTKTKRLISVVLSVLLIVSVIVPGTVFSVAAAESYPAPILSTNPQLLKEFAKPDVEIPTDDFSETYAPTFSGEVAADAPQIATVTAQAGPNDSITISGTSLSDASVYAYGLVDGEGKIIELKETLNTADTINAIIDYTFDYSMYIVWVKSASGKMSAPVRVNAPELTWQSTTTLSAGKDINLYGKFLTTNNADGEDAKAYVYVTNGTSCYEATVKKANPYKVTVTMPENLANGNYKIWLHNGHGGNYGWSNSLDVVINAGVENIWTGDTHTVVMPSSKKAEQQAIRDAVSAASDYDTVYLPAGDYYIRQGNWYIDEKLRFVGETDTEGNPLARLIFVTTQNGGNDSFKAGTAAFKICDFPSEFRNLIFMDNIDPTVTAQFNINYSYCNFINATGERSTEDHDGFVLEDCKFITRRTPGGKETATMTYDHLKARYTNDLPADNIDASRYSQNGGVSEPVWVGGIKNVYINRNYIKAPLGIDTSGCEYAFVTNNTLVGVWIQKDAHSGGCIRDFSSSKLEISGNIVRGQDYHDDPSGELTINDQTFGRGIVIQTPSRSDENLYIADNDLERVGQSDINAGELILFEGLASLYKGGLNGISNDTKTITLDTSVSAKWEEKWKLNTDNGEYYMTGYATHDYSHNDGKLISVSHNPRKIKGQRVVIANGKGVGQWRTIVDVGSNSVTVDRPWDVAPDETSYLFIAPACENVVLFRNTIKGFKNVNQSVNSTIGIQAYDTMLDTVADRNHFENVSEGVVMSCHWDNRVYEGAYERNSDGTPDLENPIEKDVQADYGFSVFTQFLNMNNTIKNARYGYSLPSITTINGTGDNKYNGGKAADDDFRNTDAEVRLQMGTVIRGNKLENIDFSMKLEKTSGIAFNIGRCPSEPDSPNRQAITNEIYLSEIVIENNTTRAVDVQNVLMGYQQKNIVFRNNNFQNFGRESEFITYSPKPSKNTDKYTINPLIYHSDYGTTADGMHISADNVESTASFINGNFEQGLKYWADVTVKGTAGDVAAIVTEGENEYLEITAKSGIKSVGFHVDNIKSGEKYAFVYDEKGSGNAKVILSGRAIFTPSTITRALARGNAIEGFTKKITNAVTVSEVIDPSIVDINCTIKGDGTNNTSIDNIELVRVYEDKGYFETLDGDKYYLADGQAFGGNEADGMLQNAEYVATEGMQNNDFSEGLKFWSNVDGTALASNMASVQNGEVTFVKGKDNGIMSAPFKISEHLLSGSESENKAAFIVNYVTGTRFSANLYVNGVNVGTSNPSTPNTTLKYRILSFDVAFNANDTYQLVLYSTSTTAVKIDYVNVARYKSSTAFTDLVTGKLYNQAGEITATTFTPEFYNGDFADGLNYWVTTGTVSAQNGVASLTGATLQSAYFDPHLEDGDKVAVLYRYKKTTDANTQITLMQTSAQTPLALKTLEVATDYTLAITNFATFTQASGTQNYLYVKLEGTAYFDYVRIVKVEEDKNLYTDLKTGERYYSDLSAYGGTAEEGVGTEAHEKWVADLQDNLDLSNGFKYLRSTDSNKAISDIVTIEDNTLVFNTANLSLHGGITTAAFKFPAHAVGKKAVMLFDGRFNCPVNDAGGVPMSIAALSLKDSEGKSLSTSFCQNTDNQWNSYVSAPYTITNVADTYLYSMTINNAYDLANCKMAIKNLRMVFVDEGGTGAYYNFDCSPIGTIYGDANEDGKVDLIDYLRTANYIAGVSGTKIYKAAANLDKDLNITLTADDLCLLKEYLLSGVKNF